MEESKRTTTLISHLSSSIKNKQKKKQKKNREKKKKKRKDTILWQNVCCLTIHQIALSSLWLQPVGKPVVFVAEME